MATAHTIRWIRVLVGGLLIEVTLFLTNIPFAILLFVLGEPVLYYALPLLAVAIAVPWSWWTAKTAGGRFVLHGVLTAAAASVIYFGVTAAVSDGDNPLLYYASNGLRLLGGGIGGWIAARGSIVPAKTASAG